MIKFFKLLTLILLLTTSSFAQRIELIRSEMYAGNFEPIMRKLNYDEIQGSPYLTEDLIKGYVKFKLGDSSVHFLRYNIYTEEMEYLDGQQLFVINNPKEVDFVSVAGHQFVYTNYKYRNSLKEGYLEKLFDGICKLYVQYDVDFEKRQNAKSSYDKPEPDKFVTKLPKWYFSDHSGQIINFPPDNSGIEKVTYDKYPQVKAYMKKEKLKPRKQDDLIKIFYYYNSLLKYQ